jgi:hypothetical protein
MACDENISQGSTATTASRPTTPRQVNNQHTYVPPTMKAFKAILASTLVVTSSAALLVPSSKTPLSAARLSNDHQKAIMNNPGIQLPTIEEGGSDNNGPPSTGPPNSNVILSDVIGSQRSINIFASFTRDISSVESRLNTAGLNTTVLAPSNSALSALPRKPWEDPEDYAKYGADAYDSKSGGEDRAHRNLRRFTEAHVVFASPWKEGEKAERMGGGVLWWETKDGKTFVQPGNVEVEGVVSKVANGEVWVVKGVLNYAS